MENPNSGKDDERSDQRDRHGEQWNQGRAPALQEEVHDEDHQDDGDQQRLDDLLDPFRHRSRGVQRNRVIDASRKPLPLLGEKGFRPLRRPARHSSLAAGRRR